MRFYNKFNDMRSILKTNFNTMSYLRSAFPPFPTIMLRYGPVSELSSNISQLQEKNLAPRTRARYCFSIRVFILMFCLLTYCEDNKCISLGIKIISLFSFLLVLFFSLFFYFTRHLLVPMRFPEADMPLRQKPGVPC